MAILVCSKCEVRNYLDPYSFWDYEGNYKCAGCDTVYYVKKDNGQLVDGPTEVTGADAETYELPGFAETLDYSPIDEAGKVAPPVLARADYVGKPIPRTESVRGNPMSGRPLSPEELVGSTAKWIYDLKNLGRVRS
ncbi:MAG: hypothetical protein ACE5LU_06105 [Anaerolineae bacterium]